MIERLSNFLAGLQVRRLILFKPAELFERINRLPWYKGTLHQWLDDQKLPDGAKVLEAGCATGALTSYIAEAGHAATGVDLSSGMIERAKANYINIDYAVADVLDLPFKSNTFDAVLATSLLNIVDDKAKAVSELSRVCKKRGRVSILVPLDTFDDKNLVSLQQSIGESGFSAAAMRAWHRYAPKMRQDEITTLFLEAGLAEPDTETYLQGLVISVSADKP